MLCWAHAPLSQSLQLDGWQDGFLQVSLARLSRKARCVAAVEWAANDKRFVTALKQIFKNLERQSEKELKHERRGVDVAIMQRSYEWLVAARGVTEEQTETNLLVITVVQKQEVHSRLLLCIDTCVCVHLNVSALTVKAILRQVHVQHEVVVVQLSISWGFQIIQDVLGTMTMAGAILVHWSHREPDITAALASLCSFVCGRRAVGRNAWSHQRSDTQEKRGKLTGAVCTLCLTLFSNGWYEDGLFVCVLLPEHQS